MTKWLIFQNSVTFGKQALGVGMIILANVAEDPATMLCCKNVKILPIG